MRFKKMILMAALTTCALVFPFAGESKMFDIGMEYVCAETYEDYEYTVNVTSNKATITKYNGSASELVIPSQIDGRDVTVIGAYAFEGSNIESITLSNRLTLIDSGAFSQCKNLTSIEIPANVTKINGYAFAMCENLKNITFKEGCQINDWGQCVFKGTAIERIVIPSGITKISDYDFKDCSSLKEITLSKDLEEFDSCAFEGCYNIEEITIEEGNAIYKCESNALIKKENNELVWGCKTTVIPDYVTRIGNGAFEDCIGLTEFTIPKQVTYIGNDAFDSTGLSEIEIPETVTEVGNWAFSGCENLTTVEIKAQLTTLGKHIFSNNTKLENVKLPDSMTSIGDYAFSTCKGLKSIKLPDGVKDIGEGAFKDCTSLESIEIPDVVTSIGNRAFTGCTGLEAITIPNGVTSIGEYTFQCCTNLTSIALPDGITSIGKYAFQQCTSLESIKIPDGVERIEMNTFYECYELKSIEFPDELTIIDEGAFKCCTSLESIKMPDGVTNIGYAAFYDCRSLANVELSDCLTSIGTHAFCGCSSLESVEIPRGITALEWYIFGDCSNLKTVKIPSSVTSINNALAGSDNVVIVCDYGTYAHTYAQENNIKYCICLNEDDVDITLDEDEYTYTGTEIQPEVMVEVKGDLLVQGTDYDVTYSENVNVGTAKVTINGIGSYLGTLERTFEIQVATITDVTLDVSEYTYDGTAKTPGVIVKSGAVTLVDGTDYEVTYSNNVNAGTATVTVSGKGNYTGVVEKTFTIKLEETSEKDPSETPGKDPAETPEKDPAKMPEENPKEEIAPKKVVSLKQKASYSTSAVQISWEKVADATKYQIYVATSKKGKYKLVATTTKTSYKNTGLSAGRTYYYKVRAYKEVNGEKLYGEYSSAVKTITKTKKVTIKAKTSGTRKVKLTWKKATGAEGYEIYMKTGKNGKYKKLKTLSNKVTYTTSKLNRGKRYYFKVRTYRKAGKTKVYSDWSNVKNITIK